MLVPIFQGFWKKLALFKGIQEIEIIVIDSGSCDNTLDDARKFEYQIHKMIRKILTMELPGILVQKRPEARDISVSGSGCNSNRGFLAIFDG